jgi:hypothetical protein
MVGLRLVPNRCDGQAHLLKGVPLATIGANRRLSSHDFMQIPYHARQCAFPAKVRRKAPAFVGQWMALRMASDANLPWAGTSFRCSASRLARR